MEQHPQHVTRYILRKYTLHGGKINIQLSEDKNRKPPRLLLINSKPDFYVSFSHRHYDTISGWKSLRKIKVNVIETHFNIPVARYVVSAYILFA